MQVNVKHCECCYHTLIKGDLSVKDDANKAQVEVKRWDHAGGYVWCITNTSTYHQFNITFKWTKPVEYII